MSDSRKLYLDLLKKILTNVIYQDAGRDWTTEEPRYDPEVRRTGMDWPVAAHTMVGLERLDNIHALLERVHDEQVPGDVIETGVWRGGVCIFMLAFLHAYGIKDRKVWVADSFEGIPVTDQSSHPMDFEMSLHRFNDILSVGLDEVKKNFEAYNLLDDRVQFLPGWFRDTLPAAPITQLSIMRLDGDLYESTMDALHNLYPKLSPGGFVVIDDYFIEPCRKAVQEFRSRNEIEDDIVPIDASSVYWRRSA
ncbi:TylF/MycF/NovP-related O-methyltransferase [Streptomyces vinaceus]